MEKKPHRTFWDCKCCQQRLGPIPDDTLLQVVTERFLAVCLNPHMVEPAKESAESLSIQAARLTNEINQAMNQREVEPNELLLLILECAAEKYKTCSIKEADHLTITLKALFQAHSNDTTLDRELFERAVKQGDSAAGRICAASSAERYRGLKGDVSMAQKNSYRNPGEPSAG